MPSFIILLVCLAGTPALADISIKKSVPQKRTVVLQADDAEELTPGLRLMVDELGEECILKVKTIKGRVATASVAECRDLKSVNPGQSLSPYTGEVVEVKKGKTKSTLRHQVGAQVYYSLADSFEGGYSTNVLSSTQSIESTDRGNGAVGFGLRYQLLTRMGLGGYVAFNYELPRTMADRTTNPGSTASYTDGTHSLMWAEGNALYQLSDFFGFAGANYSLPSVDGKDFNRTTVSGAIGFQGGVGYFVTDSIGLEASYRAINQEVSVNDSIVGVVNYDYSRLWGFLFRAVYLFEL